MRKHIWPDDVHLDEKVLEEAEAKADEKVNALKDDFQKQLSRVLEGQEHTDARLKGVASEIGKLVDKAISQSRKLEIEARAETLREHVINVIRNLSQRRGVAKADEIVDRLEDRFRSIAVIEELRRMKADGVIMYDGDLVPDRPITLR